MLVLTAGQRGVVRGLNLVKGVALNPLPLLDGTFILPERVLTDPNFSQAQRAALRGFSRRTIDWSEVPWNITENAGRMGPVAER